MNHLLKTCNRRYVSTAVNKFLRQLFVLLVIVFPATSSYSQCSPNCTGTNTFFGEAVGTVTTGEDNSFFGYQAGKLNTDGFSNSFFGNEAGRDNKGGRRNSFFGNEAGLENETGVANSFFGNEAGRINTDGGGNSFFGHHAGVFNTTGGANSFFGHQAGLENETGDANSFFGHGAGRRITAGNSNVCIGNFSGPTTGNSNVNNRLYVDIEESDEPLIYAEFDNDFVRINGTFEVTAGLANPSSRALKQEFLALDASTVLAKLSTLDVQQWSYKHRPDEKHVGPVAEEFYALFGLGEGETTISTIDTDGVMMLAIQALKEENEMLKSKLADQQEQLFKQTRILNEIIKRLDQ